MLVRFARAATVGAALVVLPIGCASGGPDSSIDPVELGRVAEGITADSIMARAKEWVADKVLYCSVANHKWDAVCGYTCDRPTAAWDAYRSDCSGFVSWCWQISWQPSSRTYMVDRAGADGWTTIPIDSLSAGDALVCNGHVMIFSRWVTSTSFEIYQESNCGKVANVRTGTFKRNPDGTLLIGTDTRIYHPIRRNGLTTPPADTGVPDTAKPDTSASDAATVDTAVPDTTSADAVPPIEDAGVPEATALPDDELPGDDGTVGAPMTGSCSLGSTSSTPGLVVWLALGLSWALRRRTATRR